jgi:hypothetical protein
MPLKFYMGTLMMSRYLLGVFMKQYDFKWRAQNHKIPKINENGLSCQLSTMIYIQRMDFYKGFRSYISRAPTDVHVEPEISGNGPILVEKCLFVRVLGLSGAVGGDSTGSRALPFCIAE